MARNASVARVVPDSPLAVPRNRRWLLRQGVAAGAALPLLGALPASAARQTPQAETDYFGYAIEPAQQDGGTAIVQLPGEASSLYPVAYDGYFSGSTWGYGGLVWESLATLHPDTGEYVPSSPPAGRPPRTASPGPSTFARASPGTTAPRSPPRTSSSATNPP